MSERRKPRTCEVCSTTYEPTYSQQRTCGRDCGWTLRGRGTERALSKRDLNAPITAERRWLAEETKNKNREYMRLYVGNQYRTNPAVRDRMRSNSARRSARLRGSTYTSTISLEAIATRDNNRCHICHKHVAQHQRSLDHLIPVSKGGQHVLENVALAHLRCNSSRGAGRTDAQLLLVG